MRFFATRPGAAMAPGVALTLAVALAALLTMQTGAPAQDAVPSTRSQIALSFAPVVKKTMPAVVNVYARRVVRQQGRPPLMGLFPELFGGGGFGVPRERVQQSLGSGVIVSPDGVVVTNTHVIADATDIRIALSDRREFAAEVVLKDERSDLAVLRLVGAKEALPFLGIGDSDQLEVGDLVLAIGNPFGVGQTVTSGIVSATSRTNIGASDYQFFVQTDAAINQGNSGGALVAMDGRLVGINTFIFTRSGGSNGIGFAIPSNMVRVVVEAAKVGGTVRRPWIGAAVQPVTPEIAESLQLRAPVGVLVNAVHKAGPAAAAGLAVGDLILAVDGHEVNDADSFGFRLATVGIGKTARLDILRNGAKKSLQLALQPPPEDPPRELTKLEGRNPLAGATVLNLSPAVADELRLDFDAAGVVISHVEPYSLAARFGFERGDIVRAVNGDAITSVGDLRRALAQDAYRWQLVIGRGGQDRTLIIGG